MESSVKKPHHILLLGNHNPHLLNIVAQTMEKDGFQVTKAVSGKSAAEELQKIGIIYEDYTKITWLCPEILVAVASLISMYFCGYCLQSGYTPHAR